MLYLAFWTIMAISRRKKARSRDYALLVSNDFNGSLYYIMGRMSRHTYIMLHSVGVLRAMSNCPLQ